MDYIEKLFKQHPFIYHIGDKYYAFGNGVCAECDMHSVLLEGRYKTFELNVDNEELTQKEAWELFHKLVFEAECVRGDAEFCSNPKDEISKFNFDEKQQDELKRQIERYIAFYRKHSLVDYFK